MDSEFNHLKAREDRGVLVLEVVHNRLRDYDLCNELGKELEDAFHASPCEHVAVDLRNVELIASVGYMPLLGLSGNVQRSGGQMAVCNMSENVADVFATTRTLINPRQHDAPFLGANDLESAIVQLTSSP